LRLVYIFTTLINKKVLLHHISLSIFKIQSKSRTRPFTKLVANFSYEGVFYCARCTEL